MDKKSLIDAIEKEKPCCPDNNYYIGYNNGLTMAQAIALNLDVVDAVKVVHGRWEKASEMMPIYRCSICKKRNLFKNGNNVLSNYCPNCGAKMDGDKNDST